MTVRVSQMNACAFCLDMHCREAREDGETSERLDAIATWRESPFFSDRERAALAWAEALTDLHDGHVADSVYDEVRRQFSEKELLALTMATVAINSWNRITVAFRWDPRSYRPSTQRSSPAPNAERSQGERR